MSSILFTRRRILAGAALGLGAERHLGYKQAKYLMRIELRESFGALGRGKGGFWETEVTNGMPEYEAFAG